MVVPFFWLLKILVLIFFFLIFFLKRDSFSWLSFFELSLTIVWFCFFIEAAVCSNNSYILIIVWVVCDISWWEIFKPFVSNFLAGTQVCIKMKSLGCIFCLSKKWVLKYRPDCASGEGGPVHTSQNTLQA